MFLTASLKVKDKELYNLKKESAKVKEDLEQLNDKYKELQVKVNKDKKEEVRKLKKQSKQDFLSDRKTEKNLNIVYCDLCSENVSNMTNLKAHVRFHHMLCNSTQTDEKPFENKQIQTTCSEPKVIKSEESFESYPCFYCSNLIVHEKYLQNHREKCQVKQPILISFFLRLLLFTHFGETPVAEN